MTRLIPLLLAVGIVGAVIAQTRTTPPTPGRPAQPAQPGQAGSSTSTGGGAQQMRDMQMRALTALQQDITKLRASMETSIPAGTQNMSPEEQAKMRDRMATNRQEQQKTIADMESQLAALKGRGQMQTDHQKAIAELQAIQNQAKQENAAKTADMIGKMIQEKQTKHDQMMEKMGGAAAQP